LHPHDILWWSKGGLLHGESAPRIAFLHELLENSPATGLDPIAGVVNALPCAGKTHEFYLIYTGVSQPALLEISLPEGEQYQAEVIDTWGMSVTRGGRYSGRVDIPMPGKAYHTLLLRRAQP